ASSAQAISAGCANIFWNRTFVAGGDLPTTGLGNYTFEAGETITVVNTITSGAGKTITYTFGTLTFATGPGTTNNGQIQASGSLATSVSITGGGGNTSSITISCTAAPPPARPNRSARP